MKELICKADIVEEIEKIYNEDYKFLPSDLVESVQDFKDDLLIALDTLEMKEVNLDKEINEWMKYGPHTSYPWCTIPDAIKITAEHFFELGLKAQKGK